MKKKTLVYVFEVSFLSCSRLGLWLPVRHTEYVDTDSCKHTPGALAGKIAARNLKPGESGVKVRFIGLREKNTEGPTTSIGNLEATLLRT